MSTQTKWTPGPWVNDDGLVCGRESRPEFRENMPSIDIFDAREWPRSLENEAAANAALIAAAPELYEALERAERKLSAYVGVCKDDKELTDTVLPMARIALFKARGE